ncbi:MAG: nitroreductase [Deltaproteobacteria bacterium CG11_big_fil_rev_8_21_14_0_20_49_13]|nr:MAG: nitroreductase [Deltaproteobacteria bacterium CG11_big_fil_rev_8_21_14_0_20_49_13]
MSFIELVKKRRSIRKFKPDPVSNEQVMQVLETARLAPSGNNSQPWRFVIVRDEKIRRALYETSGQQRFMLEAPMVIALLADITCRVPSPASVNHPENADNLRKIIRDTSIGGEHVALAATDLGLATCWNAMFAQGDVKPVLKVPDDHYVVAIFALGYANEAPPMRPRRPLKELIYNEEFGKR